MSIAQSLLPEWDHEMNNTRRALERVPTEKFEWRPHDKSWTLRQLATHIANIPIWGRETLARTEIDRTRARFREDRSHTGERGQRARSAGLRRDPARARGMDVVRRIQQSPAQRQNLAPGIRILRVERM